MLKYNKNSFLVLLSFISILFLENKIFAQYNDVRILNTGEQVIFQKSGIIEFAQIGTIDKKKPLIVLIEGSLPIPSFYQKNDSCYYLGQKSILNLSIENNIIILGKPEIPILQNYDDFNSDFIFRDSSGQIPENFLINDNLSFYTKNYLSIIKKIKAKNNIKTIFVFGHSQGARIATELALDKNINGLIYSSADPLGRIASVVDEIYSQHEKMEKQNFIYSLIEDKGNSKDSTFMSSTFYTWYSFSYPTIVTLFKVKGPILIVNGENDSNCPNCYFFKNIHDYLPNATSKSFPLLNHFYMDQEGNHHMNEVIDYIQDWIDSIIH